MTNEIAVPPGAERYAKIRRFEPNGAAADGYEPPGEPIARDALSPRTLEIVRASDFARRSVSERPWLVRDMIPRRTVTMLSGDGGTGKSLLMVQLCAAVAAGGDWIGTMPEGGNVAYVSAEDDLDEIHRRLAAICSAQRIDLASLEKFHIACLAGRDAVMAAPNGNRLLAATPLWQNLVDELTTIKPRLVIIDNLADCFAGNENARPEARQFIGMLRGLAIDHDCAVVLISHPSLDGLRSGSGTSGSTAWSNSVRSRLYFERVKGDDGIETDPDIRTLRSMKANYAPVGAEVRVRWDKGCFRPDGIASTFDRAAAEANADQVFLDLLAQFERDGRDVSAKTSPTYAPTVFAKHPSAKGISKDAFRKAMDRLFASQKIKVEKRGSPSRERSRIVLADIA